MSELVGRTKHEVAGVSGSGWRTPQLMAEPEKHNNTVGPSLLGSCACNSVKEAV